ncbi:hypothetical protein A2U01_0098170, partial [Trifolium medium]|nr:hypothetical protein [Trifolium medium]
EQLADNPARINRLAAPSHVLHRINSTPINAGQLTYRMRGYVTASPSNTGEILTVTLNGLLNRPIKGTLGPALGAL